MRNSSFLSDSRKMAENSEFSGISEISETYCVTLQRTK